MNHIDNLNVKKVYLGNVLVTINAFAKFDTTLDIIEHGSRSAKIFPWNIQNDFTGCFQESLLGVAQRSVFQNLRTIQLLQIK